MVKVELDWQRIHFPRQTLKQKLENFVMAYIIGPLAWRSIGFKPHLSELIKIDKNTDWKAFGPFDPDPRGEGF
ncbi:hypothetical protein A3A79_00080 [Candidatus Gottesmanbacteria bacterium RIFCSPLOWO2_01_FULL_43_11b]|uniref:Uncharacterized protein n=1 Tax=Candidatus Gottesmanbacteria bacterium RIFCSPLOWO2_01_FULL_43_11b TaxID=1798392 RepID=A0A1F6AH67_9BACT|nr:MAG: hypothetical protein A3A79_00080 [Candidatus Gottesmanbacteria bacterium RIFCSPLOWO2_01_FULL_43_11b]